MNDFFSAFREDEDENILTDTSPVISDSTPVIEAKTSNDFFASFKDEDELVSEAPENPVKTVGDRENIEKNSAVRQAAVRFMRDKHGVKDVDEDEAMDEFIEHFRQFNVNEMTAAGDYNYVSALAADATGKTKLDAKRRETAKQKLADYRLLYTTFQDLPSFTGGVGQTIGDYAGGVLTAPSTYLGLLLPGVGKAGGVAATSAAKAATQSVLTNAFKTLLPSNVIKQAAARPVATAALVEGMAGSAQNIAAQKTEQELNLRDDFSLGETAAAGVLSAAMPAAVGVYQTKKLAQKAIESRTGDLLGEAQKSILIKNEAAEKLAEETLKKNKLNKEIAKELSTALRPLDPKQVAAGKVVREDLGEQVGLGVTDDVTGLAKTLGVKEEDVVAEAPDFVLSLNEGHTKRIFAAVTELMAKSGKGLEEGERVTEAVARVMRSDKIKDDDFAVKLFEKYNITGDDFANLFMADISDAARKLQSAGQARQMFKRLNAAAGNDIFELATQTKELVAKATKDVEKGDLRAGLDSLGVATKEQLKRAETTRAGELMDKLRKADELRRSAMTSQVATTMRNMASGYARVGIDTLTKALDRGTSRFVYGATGGKYGFKTVNAQDGIGGDTLSVLFGLMNQKETQAVEAMFKEGFSAKATSMFRELQDVIESGVPGSAKTSKLRTIGKELNALNTASDNLFKRAAFVGNLKRQLNEMYSKKLRAGESVNIEEFNLSNIIKEGKFNTVFGTKSGKKALDTAIDEALYFTYQRSPTGPAGKGLIGLANSIPFVTSSFIPFPRFIANALRFTYEYSPVYLVEGTFKSLVKDSNNYEEMSKALIGTAGLYGAMAFRDSENAGEKWYEGRRDDGTTYDMRPFFPAAPFLWAADIINRVKNDDPVIGDTSFWTEGLQALSGTQFRAGFGLYALDKAAADMASAKDSPEALQKIGINMATNIINTYSIPLTLGQDLYNTFYAPDDERIVRQSDSSDMMSYGINRILSRVPGNVALEKMISESIGMKERDLYQPATREGVVRRVTPLSRQTLGILKQERKNWFEKELDTLKISKKIVNSKTGVPEADFLLNQFMGEYIEDYVVPTLKNDPEYTGKSREFKKEMIRRAIDDYKNDIVDIVKARAKTAKGDTELKSRYGFNPMEAMEFKNLPKYAQEGAYNEYHRLHGIPEKGVAGYNYEELIFYGKYLKERGPRESGK
tara:strand:+ start:3905 stop:7492 length:3588 start_codon:yes stop_codon:yes gene_type:complete